MSIYPPDGTIYAHLFGDEKTALLFTGPAEVKAMLAVEAALAEVQGALGVIPAESAGYLGPLCRTLVIDPSALARQTGVDGVPVPALVAAVRSAVGAPEHTQYLHWGATSQDIVDTALALRLRQLIALWDERLGKLGRVLADLAEVHAELPMAARTYGQVATPTSFGAVVASWGRPILRHLLRLRNLRSEVLKVSLSGAAGTLAAMGPKGPEVRAALAEALGLSDPSSSWHSERDSIAAFAGWIAGLTASLGKMGEDLILLSQSGVGEVVLASGGRSSTMPQKQNPVSPSVLVALARFATGLAGVLQGASIHRQQRDGTAWFTEWLSLPQLCIVTGRALSLSLDLTARIAPDVEAMARNMEDQAGTIHAEALSFSLTNRISRPEAQAVIKDLAQEALQTGRLLPELVRRDFPDLDWPGTDLGQAAKEARTFAQAARDASPP